MRKILLLLFVLLVPYRAQASSYVVEEVVSPGGIKAWFVSDDKLPLISMRFAWRGGVEQDPVAKQGLARLTAEMLTHGAGDLDSATFQKALADHSIGLSFSAGRDSFDGSLKTLRETRGKAFNLLKLALSKPRFDTPEFTLAKAQHYSGIQYSLGSASWQGRSAMLDLLYADHPYAYRSLGTAATLNALTVEDCRSFIARHLAQDNLVISVVGAISRQELTLVLDEIFGVLPARAADQPIADIQPKLDNTTLVVSREGTQSEIFWAAPAPNRNDKDWYVATVAHYILGGGGFSSRLMKAVRDKEGLTYGIGSSMLAMDHSAFLLGSVAAENSRAGDVVDLIRDVWREYTGNGPTDKEVEAAKDYLIGSAPLSLTTTSAIAEWLTGLQLEGYPRDYLDRRAQLLRKVTTADVRAFLNQWWKNAPLTWVAVGQPHGLSAAKVISQKQE